jgi:hypothetical protein
MRRQRKIEELRILIRLAKEAKKNPNKLIAKKRTFEDENKITRCNLMSNPEKYLSPYALVTFRTYTDAYETFKREKIPHVRISRGQKVDNLGRPDVEILQEFTGGSGGSHDLNSEEKFVKKTEISLKLSPHPFDIDWNCYNEENMTQSNLVHIIAWTCVLLILPVATYFVEFKLSMNLALHLRLLVTDKDTTFIANTF